MLYDNELVTDESLKTIFTDHGKGYGYGWFVGKDDKGRMKYQHPGVVYGIVSDIISYPEEHALIIVIRNVVPPQLVDDRIHTDLANMLLMEMEMKQ